MVTTYESVYELLHGPEALGLSKAPNEQTTIEALFMRDCTLP